MTSNYNGADLSCATATDGQITVTGTGGTAPYQYEIDAGGYAAPNVFNTLGAGTYTMGIRDAKGCMDTDDVTITPPVAITGSALVTSDYSTFSVSCNGSSDGQVTISAAGGTGAYTYEILEIPGNLTGKFTGIFSNVPSGLYTIRITDANGCQNSIPITVTLTEPPVLTGINAVTSTYYGADVSCFGASDGEIEVTTNGGTGAGTYTWLLIQNPGNTTGDADGTYENLPAGTYTVRVTDDNNCTMTSNAVTLDNPTQITATISVTSDHGGADISCPGDNDGEITVVGSGGTTGLRYKLVQDPANVSGKSTGIFTGVSAGTYSVQVFDSNGCFINTAFVTLQDPLAISAFTSVTSNYNGSEIRCVDEDNGEITVSAFGGTGLKHFVLDQDVGNVTGADDGVFTGLSPGSYTVTVTDSNGCSVQTAPVSVDEPPAISGTTTIFSNFNGADVSCFGENDGSIRTTASGGTGLLIYDLVGVPGNSTGDANGIYTDLTSGTYTVRIIDVNTCFVDAAPITLVDPIVVSETHNISSNFNGSHVSCAGASDGEITVNGAGGTGTLTYGLDQDAGNTTGNLSGVYRNLDAGTWTVTVTDMNGCDVNTGNIDIIDPLPVTSTAVKQSPYAGEDISCAGGSNGVVDVTGGGGTGGYTYSIEEVPGNTSGETTGQFTGLSAGTYTFRSTDDNGCYAISDPVTLADPPAISYTINITSNHNGSDISCPTLNDGEITVVGSDGTGTLTYVLDQDLGNTTGNAGGVYTGLIAGTYTVTITDQNTCSVQTSSVTLDDPTPISGTSSVTSNYNGAEVTCFGASDGVIRAVASGGTGTLTYVFDSIPGNTTGETTGQFTGLPSGIYTVTISDLNGCSFTTENDTIDDPVAISATAAVSSDFFGEDLSCFGTNDGEITVTALDGTGAYTYVLDQIPTNITGKFSGVFQGLSSGTYSVSVTDANNCPITTTDVDIVDPPVLTATGSVTSDYNGSDVTCFGDSDGEITIAKTGGTGIIHYELIQIPANLTGEYNGVFTDLPAAAYTVRVTDTNGCVVITNPTTVQNPALLTATAAVTSDYFGSELRCNGYTDGEITVTANGGTGVYSYLLNPAVNATGDATGIYEDLPSGSYTVRVRDENLCEVTTIAVTIDEPPLLVASAAVTSNYNGEHLTCFGASDGRITVTATGGTGTLFYALTGPVVNTTGDVTGIYTGLPSGSYTVLVTDQNGCFVNTVAVDIDEPDEITGTADITSDYNGSHVSCIGASDGEITVTVIGGTVSLQYSANGGLSWQANPVFDRLPAATYHIKVKDVNNCQLDLGTLDIVNPAQVIIDSVRVTSDFNGRHISCATSTDGEATVYPIGGTTTLTGNLNYEWFSDPAYTVSIGQTTATATNLAAGIYYVKVWDDNNCTAYGNVTVSAPPALFGTATVSSNHNGAQVSCFNALDGEITIMAFNGTPGYEYSVDNKVSWSKNNAIGGLGAGNHEVWIMDTNACEYNVGTTIIIEPSEVIASAVVSSNYFGQDVKCVGSTDGAITVTASGGTGALQYSKNAGVDWQLTPVFSGLGAGTYDIDVKDVNDCGTTVNGIVISDPPALTGTAAITSNHSGAHVSCAGAFDGEITITVTSNGSGTVMYSRNGGTTYQALPTFTNLNAGTYNMFIRDINMCEFDLGNVTIVDPAAMTITSVDVTSDHNGRDISCVGASDGAAMVSHTGGTGTIQYIWYSDAGYSLPIGQTTQTATNLSAGTYYVKVFDDNACFAYGNVTLVNPPALSSTITITSSFTGGYHVSCNGANNGTIDLTPAGGTAPYTYLWTGPSINAGNETNQNQTALLAGTYDVTITDDNSCTTTAQAILVEPNVLTVSVAPTITYSGGYHVTCNGEKDGGINSSVAGGSGAGTYTYVWTGPDVTSPTDPNQTNLGAGAYTVDVTDANGCTAQANLTLTEPPLLQAVATSANDYNGYDISCYGGTNGGIDLDTIGGVKPFTYMWTGPLGFVSNAQNLSGLRAGIYNITLRDANNCSAIDAITLTEPNQLAATATVTTDYFGYSVSCNGNSDADIDLVITEGVTPYTVLWTGPSINAGNQNNVDLTGVAAGNYQATITDANGCITSENVTVTEPAALNPGQITGTQLVCYLSNPTLLNQAFGASGGPTTRVYQWEISTTLDTGPFSAISGAMGPTYDPPAGITQTSHYRRSVTSGACATEYSNVVTVTVNPLPVAVLAGDADICEGTSTDIAITISAGTKPFTVNIDNGVGVISDYRSADPITVTPFTAPVTYNLVSVIDSFGCQVSSPHANITGSATVTWKEKVGISAQPVDMTICETQNTSFSVTATGETPYSYQWYENNVLMTGETNATLSLTAVPATMDGNFYHVEVTDACGFTKLSDFVNLTVQTNTVIVKQPETTNICENLATNFTVNATGTIIGYQWQENDGGGWQDLSESGQYVGTTTGKLSVFGVDSAMTNYQYQVIISGICTPTTTSNAATLIVKTSPVIFVQPTDVASCETVATNFTVSAYGDTISYQWQVNSGGGFADIPEGGAYTGTQTNTLTLTSPNVTTQNGNLYRVLISGACNPPVVSDIAQLTVNTFPSVNDHPKDVELCEDGSKTFTAGALGTGITYHWQENTGSGYSDITNGGIYSGANTQSLTLTTIPTTNNGYKYRMQVRGSCATVNSSAATMIVNANPTASITDDGIQTPGESPIVVCGGNPLNLDGNPTGGSGSYNKHEWTGDIFYLSTVSAQKTIFQTILDGTYNYTYTVTDSKGCVAKAQTKVINDRPDARFSSDAKPSCGTVTVTFTNESNGAVSYRWDMDDPANPGEIKVESPVHGFSNFTSTVSYFNVELIGQSNYGCRDTAKQVITVFPSIDATFTITPDEDCNPVKGVMEAIPGGSNYAWDYGDGNGNSAGTYRAFNEFSNTGTDPVTYTVTLITTSFYGCIDQKTADVTVHPIPRVTFSADPIVQKYPDATVNFNNLTQEGSWSFNWDFDDENSSTETSPSHTYDAPGIYKVKLTAVTALCSDSATNDITIEPATPVAAFELPESGCAPLSVDFVNNSEYGDQYLWDFGNGSVSYKKNPSFTYYEAGTFQISLTVYGPGGTDTHNEILDVKRTPTAYTNVSPPLVFVNDVPVKCFNLSSDTVNASYLWDFGDGTTSDTLQPAHVYTEPGRYDITLTVTNGNECVDEYTFSYVEVEPAGEMKFPTVFKPNQDGPADPHFRPGQDNNQIFFPGVYNQVSEYEMVIYNRWGERIFISKDVNIGWNGWIDDNRLAEQGVYIWRVRGKYANGQNFTDVGDITLLK
ncbi:PKD domain-containing protein [Bacteroidota bacterium]